MICTKCGLAAKTNRTKPAITGGAPRSLYRFVEGGLIKVDLVTGIQYFLPDNDTARAHSEANAEGIADYKESETLKMPHTDFETKK